MLLASRRVVRLLFGWSFTRLNKSTQDIPQPEYTIDTISWKDVIRFQVDDLECQCDEREVWGALIYWVFCWQSQIQRNIWSNEFTQMNQWAQQRNNSWFWNLRVSLHPSSTVLPRDGFCCVMDWQRPFFSIPYLLLVLPWSWLCCLEQT